MDPVTAIVIAGGIAAASAGVSAAGAIQQNKAISKAKEANRNAANVQKGQLTDAAANERLKREQDAAKIRSRIALLSGETGIAPDAYSGLFQQNETDLASNLRILDQNLTNEQARVDSGLQVNLAELSSRQVNPLFATFGGALQGATTGLSIATMGQALADRQKAGG